MKIVDGMDRGSDVKGNKEILLSVSVSKSILMVARRDSAACAVIDRMLRMTF